MICPGHRANTAGSGSRAGQALILPLQPPGDNRQANTAQAQMVQHKVKDFKKTRGSSAKIGGKMLENKNLYFTLVPSTTLIASGVNYDTWILCELMNFLSYFGAVQDIGAFLISAKARFTWLSNPPPWSTQ